MSPEAVAVAALGLALLLAVGTLAYALVKVARSSERILLLLKARSVSEFGLASAMERTRTPEIRPSFGANGGEATEPTLEDLRGAPTSSAEFTQPS